MMLFQIESLALGLVFGLLEIVLSETQQSRDVMEGKGYSFDTLLAAVLPPLLPKCRGKLTVIEGGLL
jgi:hypothetical protein